MKGYVTNGQPIAGDTVCMHRSERQIQIVSYSRIKGPTRFGRGFDNLNLHLNQKPEEPQERLQQDYSDISNHQDDAIEIIYMFAGVILKAG